MRKAQLGVQLFITKQGPRAMRTIFGMVGLLAVLAIGYYLYTVQLRQGADGRPPIQQINIVAVRADLLSLAQAERLYLATNGSYADLEQLRQSGNFSGLPEKSRPGYVYAVEVEDGLHFRITARPTDPSRTDLPTLAIDETMHITG